MDDLNFIGGAKTGWRRSTWPFARLSASANRVDLSVSLYKYSFQPSDIVSVQIIGYTTLFSSEGLSFNHNVASYPKQIVFLCKDAQRVLQTIAATGFFEKAFDKNPLQDSVSLTIQKQGALSIKKPVAIFLIVLWNLLLLPFVISMVFRQMDIPHYRTELLAFAMVSITSILTVTTSSFRNFILKPGRTKADVSTFFYFMIFISTLLFIAFYFNPMPY